MAKQGRTLTELAAEIERRANAKADYIAPVARLEMTEDGALALQNGERNVVPVNDHAHGQIAEYAGIPLAYYRKMQAEAPALLARNVNRWMRDKDTDRRMVRTLDGNVRAFLSDKFRPLENEDLAEAILPAMMERDLLILSCEVTDRRLYIKAVDRSIEKDVPTGRKMGDGSHTFFDTLSPAITISNSEVGSGALSIETGTYTRVCTNLAMMGSNMRKYHTGARASVSDEVYALLSDKTKRLTDAATWNQVRDLVTAAFDLAKFDAMLKKLGDAAEQRIEGDVVQVIERVGRKLTLNEGERGSVLKFLIEGGDLTRYGVHSAITRSAQDAVDYDRATELERIGGDIITLEPGQWRELAIAA
jgi:hypothetical protein